MVAYVFITRDAFTLALLGCFGAMSALLPDLDHDASKGRKILDAVFMLLACFIAYFGGCGGGICLPGIAAAATMAIVFLALLGAYFLLFRLFKPRHRGITHTLVACLAFGILLIVSAGRDFAIAGMLGYLSHLAADNHLRLI